MATDTQKSESQISEVENPKKTLTLTQKDTPNLNEEPKTTSYTDDDKPESQGSDREDADGSKAKTTVVSPKDDGVPANDIQKKLRRAERFGVPVQLSEEEKRNSRAERFGTTTSSEASKTSEEQKRKARAERFGLSVPADEEAKKKARVSRFASDVKVDSLEEEKRKARAIRFSQTPSKAVSQINGKGNIEPKTAIAGDAGGGA